MASPRPTGVSTPNPEWVEFLKHVKVPKLVGEPTELRALSDYLTSIKPPVDVAGVSIRQVPIPGYENFENEARVYTPKGTHFEQTIVIYVHGGGWTIGSLDSEHSSCVKICRDAGVVVVSLNYRKAPESPFPIPLEDVWAGVLWVFNNIEALGGRRDRVIMAGNSAGANMTAVCVQRAAELQPAGTTKDVVPFRGQILRNPMVVHWDAHPTTLSFSSYEENREADVLPVEAVHRFVGFYNPPPMDLRFSPLLSENMSLLPPTYIQISGADPLRDDGFAYNERLQQAGVPVKVDVYAGVPHGFMAFPSLTAALKGEEHLNDAIKWLAAGAPEPSQIMRVT